MRIPIRIYRSKTHNSQSNCEKKQLPKVKEPRQKRASNVILILNPILASWFLRELTKHLFSAAAYQL
jgi:hypothetical protein